LVDEDAIAIWKTQPDRLARTIIKTTGKHHPRLE